MVFGGLILAARFLTIVPVPGREAGGAGALGRAAWWFPVVGAALGAALAGIDRLLATVFPPVLDALLVLVVWKVVTGGLHLDGLADTLDGLAGGDPERRLAIMRDSSIGVFGALGLILCFLMAMVALADVPMRVRWRILLLAPIVGRLSPLLAGACFRAATPGRGLGAGFLDALPRAAGPVHIVSATALAAALLGGPAMALVACPLAAVLVWLAFLARRLGGLTGDALGSAVELAEVGVLLAAASLAHVGAI